MVDEKGDKKYMREEKYGTAQPGNHDRAGNVRDDTLVIMDGLGAWICQGLSTQREGEE